MKRLRKKETERNDYAPILSQIMCKRCIKKRHGCRDPSTDDDDCCCVRSRHCRCSKHTDACKNVALPTWRATPCLVELAGWIGDCSVQLTGALACLQRILAEEARDTLCMLAEQNTQIAHVALIDNRDVDTLARHTQSYDQIHGSIVDAGNPRSWVITSDALLLNIGHTAAKPQGCHMLMLRSPSIGSLPRRRIEQVICSALDKFVRETSDRSHSKKRKRRRSHHHRHKH